MKRKVIVLQGFLYCDKSLVPKELQRTSARYFVFSTKKKANTFFKEHCTGTGLIYEDYCTNNDKFYEGLEVSKHDFK